MTDWVVAMITRSPGKVEEDKRWGVTKNRVCRNDPLGSGLGKRGRKAEARKREEVRRQGEWESQTRGCQEPSGPE